MSAVSNVSLFVFGESVQLVKPTDQEWDAACVLSLLSRFRQKHPCTHDADALRHALALLERQTGEKKVFMLTDGYGVGGLLPFAKQLKKAESAGIDVIGVSVGVDESNVDQVFGKWCKAALPPAVPDALRELFSDERSGALTSAHAADIELKLEKWKLRGEASGTVDIKEMYRSFAELQKELRKTRIATLERGDRLDTITVDLVFVVDMTGSMRQALPILLAQFHAMVDSTSEHSIPSKIFNDPTNPGIEIALHCAVLGFRDIDDPEQFVERLHPQGRFFDTSNEMENTKFLESLQQCENMAKGGGDTCEDVAGAFERAANWPYWKGKARFIVLVTDNPCHGSEFHTFGTDRFQDSRHSASSVSREAFRRGFQRCIEEDIRMLHCTCSRR